MSFSTLIAIALAMVLVFGVGYGTGINDGKEKAIDSFNDYGSFKYKGTKVISAQIIVDPKPLPAPSVERMTFEKSNGRGLE